MPRLSRVLAALSVGALVLIGSQSASAAPPCVITYQPNVWASGFTANVAVTNNGTPVTAWTVTWTCTRQPADHVRLEPRLLTDRCRAPRACSR